MLWGVMKDMGVGAGFVNVCRAVLKGEHRVRGSGGKVSSAHRADRWLKVGDPLAPPPIFSLYLDAVLREFREARKARVEAMREPPRG